MNMGIFGQQVSGVFQGAHRRGPTKAPACKFNTTLRRGVTNHGEATKRDLRLWAAKLFS